MLSCVRLFVRHQDYIHPENPDITLPKGLFVWESGWDHLGGWDAGLKGHFVGLRLQPHRFEELWKKRKPDVLYPLMQRKPGKAFYGMHKGTFKKTSGQLYNPATPGVYQHPSKAVANFFAWTPEEQANQLLDRQFFVHAILGVTEEYFRQYFGGKDRQLHLEDVTKFFPPQHPDFPQRKAIQASIGKLEVKSLENLRQELALKKPNKSIIGTGKVTLIDGYQEYIKSGGVSPTAQEKNAMMKDANLQAQFLDSPAAHKARRYTDTRRFLADSLYNDAVFQDAATRNLLEGGMEVHEALLTEMLKAAAQGEEISIATAGRSFALKYFEPRYDIFDQFFAAYEARGRTIPADQQAYENLKGLVKMGWYSDVVVTSGFWHNYVLPYPGQTPPQPPLHHRERIEYVSSLGMPNFKKRIVGNLFNQTLDAPPKVNLALVAAYNLIGQKKSPQAEALANILLEAAYELTLIAAILHGKRKIVLTLMGAGAFAGKYGDEVLDWIIRVLKRTYIVDLISTWGLDVTIINYPDLRPHRIKSPKAIKEFTDSVNELALLVDKKNKDLVQEPSTPLQQQLAALYVELTSLHRALRI